MDGMNVSGFRCSCHGQPTRSELVMAETMGLSVAEVHAFLCAWERVAAKVLDDIEEGTEQPATLIVYVVLSGAGLESVWFTPQEAIDAHDKVKERGASTSYTTVRPVGHVNNTPESEEALRNLRKMERNHHNAKAKALREAVRKHDS